MDNMERRLRLFKLANPETLFHVSKYHTWQQAECIQGHYYIEDANSMEVYRRYGEELNKAGFSLRLSLECASVWRKNAAIVVLEHFSDATSSLLCLSFVKSPKLARIYFETDKSKLFELDFKNNARWIQINRFKPYFVWLSYSHSDFSGLNFRRMIVRFADFFGCNFRNTSWHSCRFHLKVDGGDLFCIFKNCDFTGSNFLGVDFSRCQFKNCDFSECRFRNCKFDYTVMEHCCFEDFDMIRCNTEHLFFC